MYVCGPAKGYFRLEMLLAWPVGYSKLALPASTAEGSRLWWAVCSGKVALSDSTRLASFGPHGYLVWMCYLEITYNLPNHRYQSGYSYYVFGVSEEVKTPYYYSWAVPQS